MKNTTMRKLAGIAAIVTLASCMMAPMGMTAFAAAEEPTTYSITITNPSANHTYEAYQILSGDITNEEGKLILTEIAWGANVSAEGQSTLGDASDYAGTLTEANVAEAAKTLGSYLTGDAAGSVTSTTGGDYVIEGLAPGYYLVKDADDSLEGYDAYTAFILEVVGDADAVVKSALPEVDKQVWDEATDPDTDTEDANWGETADHAINETFQFKLIATLPDDSDLDSYETYKLVFNDTLSAGVVFENIVSVTVNGSGTDAYDCSATAGLTNGSFTVEIEDLVAIVGEGNLEKAVVEVIYNAHLDENAKIGDDDSNNNTVNLEYSNNPNWDGEGEEELGQAPDDTVWVFTYEMPNQKVDQDGEALSGAGFRLYDSEGNEVALIKDGDTYRPVGEGEDGEELISAETTGDFSIIGLDAGTYTLKETTVPSGYNKCADVEVVISADHAEDATSASTTISMTVDGEDSDKVVIKNEKGSSLPSTGGIGTTLFYVIGGTMAAGAGVYLISKKRMNKED